ncbi:membrane protein [Microbacterium phage Nicole72]|uniref:Membrane protein n=1 Tax=Microbacterium phage Nicole72 TaxID=3062838 RepID=A0ACD4UK12_9CAUD|nr:membrane protein [Microbacterium phage Nicole72]
MTIPTIGQRSGDNAAPSGIAPVTTGQTLNVIAFVLVVLPTAIALNVLIWAAALWFMRQS